MRVLFQQLHYLPAGGKIDLFSLLNHKLHSLFCCLLLSQPLEVLLVPQGPLTLALDPPQVLCLYFVLYLRSYFFVLGRTNEERHLKLDSLHLH